MKANALSSTLETDAALLQNSSILACFDGQTDAFRLWPVQESGELNLYSASRDSILGEREGLHWAHWAGVAAWTPASEGFIAPRLDGAEAVGAP